MFFLPIWATRRRNVKNRTLSSTLTDEVQQIANVYKLHQLDLHDRFCRFHLQQGPEVRRFCCERIQAKSLCYFAPPRVRGDADRLLFMDSSTAPKSNGGWAPACVGAEIERLISNFRPVTLAPDR